MDFNLNIFRQSDPSGKLTKESFLNKNYPNEYNYILRYCCENSISDEIPFKERVYQVLNLMKSTPNCKNPNCNKLVKFINSTLGYREYCSSGCVSGDPHIKEVKVSKSMEKYGTKTPAESQEVKNKIINTNLERYGGNSPMSDAEVMDRSKKTLYKNHGVINPAFSKDILIKRISSFKKSDFKNTYSKTSLIRYGVDHPWKRDTIHRMSIESSNSIRQKNAIETANGRLGDEYVLISSFNEDLMIKFNILCEKCGGTFIISRSDLYRRSKTNSEICTICNPISGPISGQELSLYNFIKSIYGGDVLQNSRKLISPYEVDIFIPEFNLGIEYNGLYWHSSEYRTKDYHFNKFKVAEDNSIKLIQVWEDDWIHKQDIIKSIILNNLNKSNRIWARKCSISIIDYKTSKKFLDENHLQGDCKSSIRIGLLFDGELVSIMTFSKPRISVGSKSYEDGSYELTRFCNKNNISVVGGASKLLSFFIKTYSPSKILTYSDNSISNGNLYKKLNFEFLGESSVGYWYVIDKIRTHRFNWRKSKLVKLGYDRKKSENDIMMEMGHKKIYNSGNKKWILKNKGIVD